MWSCKVIGRGKWDICKGSRVKYVYYIAHIYLSTTHIFVLVGEIKSHQPTKNWNSTLFFPLRSFIAIGTFEAPASSPAIYIGKKCVTRLYGNFLCDSCGWWRTAHSSCRIIKQKLPCIYASLHLNLREAVSRAKISRGSVKNPAPFLRYTAHQKKFQWLKLTAGPHAIRARISRHIHAQRVV